MRLSHILYDSYQHRSCQDHVTRTSYVSPVLTCTGYTSWSWAHWRYYNNKNYSCYSFHSVNCVRCMSQLISLSRTRHTQDNELTESWGHCRGCDNGNSWWFARARDQRCPLRRSRSFINKLGTVRHYKSNKRYRRRSKIQWGVAQRLWISKSFATNSIACCRGLALCPRTPAP